MEAVEKMIYLDREPFYVDLSKGQLKYTIRDKEPLNVRQWELVDGCYVAAFDRRDMSLLSAGAPDDGALLIHIPPELFQADFWKDTEQINKLNMDSHDKQWGMLVVNKALWNRLHGDLPLLDIAGSEFVVDLKHNRLVKMRDFDLSIDLGKLTLNSQGKSEGLYDTSTFQLYERSGQSRVLPPSVVGIVLPERVVLDPDVVAFELGRNAIEFMRQHPMSEKLEARVVPASALIAARQFKKTKLSGDEKNKSRAKGKGPKLH